MDFKETQGVAFKDLEAPMRQPVALKETLARSQPPAIIDSSMLSGWLAGWLAGLESKLFKDLQDFMDFY